MPTGLLPTSCSPEVWGGRAGPSVGVICAFVTGRQCSPWSPLVPTPAQPPAVQGHPGVQASLRVHGTHVGSLAVWSQGVLQPWVGEGLSRLGGGCPEAPRGWSLLPANRKLKG